VGEIIFEEYWEIEILIYLQKTIEEILEKREKKEVKR